MTPKIDLADLTIVIPTLNEESGIGPLLDDLAHGPAVEIIVADGGSVDGTAGIARDRGATVVESGPGRARQMNAGARAAGGEVLLFLHADTRLPGRYHEDVRRALEDDRTAGGAFSFSLDEKSPGLRIIEKGANFRSRRLGITFGDQAIFVRRRHFRQIGGFPLQPIMEDYEFLRRLRRRGRVVILPRAAVTSARRWRDAGIGWVTLWNYVITGAYLIGFSPERLKRWHDRVAVRTGVRR
jgi:rSAM/selenodomain-associated transferase 2